MTQTLILFILIFGFKVIHIDIGMILLSILIAVSYKKVDFKLQSSLFFIIATILFYGLYAGIISIINTSGELIFFLKFFKTALLLFLLAIYFPIYRSNISYQQFQKYFIYAVGIHSIIIILNIISPDIREFIYSLSGYSPRGPAWSRSPGITISFNSTAIIHIVALYILAFHKIIKQKLMKVFLFFLIVLSLLFLGRTISFVGLGIIFLIFFFKNIRYSLFIIVILITFVTFIENNKQNIENEQLQYIVNNYNHFTEPLFNQDKSVTSYYSKNLVEHLYFSKNISVLLFGNSYAGHIGTLGGKGETNSDIGIVNSINANGIIITALMYLLYILMVYMSKDGDIKIMIFITTLVFVLTFKETGFFSSNATVLYFFLFLYQYNLNTIKKEGKLCAEYTE